MTMLPIFFVLLYTIRPRLLVAERPCKLPVCHDIKCIRDSTTAYATDDEVRELEGGLDLIVLQLLNDGRLCGT